MDFIRRLLGGGERPPEIQIELTGGRAAYDPGDGMCYVTVGTATVPGAIYRDNYRDDADWTSGIRLEDPRTGRMLLREDRYPEPFRAAGARSVAVVGLPHHADGQRPEFAIGSYIRLVPEPTNPANPRAIAVRSVDGRYLAGYVPNDELDRIWSTQPMPQVGVIAWESYRKRPRERKALIALVGPSIRVDQVPASRATEEVARREASYARGQAEEQAEWERNREAAAERRSEQEAARAVRAAERQAAGERKAQAEVWKASGLCVDCGGVIEPTGARGRPPIRCAAHRSGPKSAAPAGDVPDHRE